MSSETPKLSPAVQELIYKEVFTSAHKFLDTSIPILPNHHEPYVQSICVAIFGAEWQYYTDDELRVKKGIARREYCRMFTRFLPLLQQFMQDANHVLKFDEATLANLSWGTDQTNAPATTAPNVAAAASERETANAGATNAGAAETSTSFEELASKELTAEAPDDGDSTDDEILRTEVAMEREAAARKNSYYERCRQGRKDLRIRRAKEPEGNMSAFSLSQIPLNDDKKTRNCLECGKTISSMHIRRHYQQSHEKDPRRVLYCPSPGCEFKCWLGGVYIRRHTASRHKSLHKELFGEEDLQKRVSARAKASASSRNTRGMSDLSRGQALDQDEEMYDEEPHETNTADQHMSDDMSG